MTNEITAEEMVGAAIETTAFNVCHIFESDPKVADMELVRHELRSLSEAIRKHLERPRVSRKQIAELLNIGHQFAMETMGDGGKRSYSEDLTLALDEMQDKLTEFGTEVEG